jgi:aspartyl-tRNA(Asn)/glutamyl-tRNA(Gln) amidotransferase subunit C
MIEFPRLPEADLGTEHPPFRDPPRMPRLSLAEVEHVALLARLELSDSEKSRLTEDLNVILEQFDRLQQLDTSNVPPTAHAIPLANVFREDRARPSLPPAEVLHGAPEGRDEFFVVPRVVEG